MIWIYESNDILFINDTTATTPEASFVALQRFLTSSGKLWWICGGSDKGLDFDIWLKIKKTPHLQPLLLSGSAEQKIKKVFKKNKIAYSEFNSLLEIFNFLKSKAEPKDTILLSPGATSFGMFKNEFDRGERFNNLTDEW